MRLGWSYSYAGSVCTVPFYRIEVLFRHVEVGPPRAVALQVPVRRAHSPRARARALWCKCMWRSAECKREGGTCNEEHIRRGSSTCACARSTSIVRRLGSPRFGSNNNAWGRARRGGGAAPGAPTCHLRPAQRHLRLAHQILILANIHLRLAHQILIFLWSFW